MSTMFLHPLMPPSGSSVHCHFLLNTISTVTSQAVHSDYEHLLTICCKIVA